ncbi:uncharacterized protein LOC144123106 isoform X2 [Amblyomma americanum]
MLLLPFLAFAVFEVGGYSMSDPTPGNKLLSLLNTKVQSYNPGNDYPVKGCSWLTPSTTQGDEDINFTMTHGHISNLVQPGLKPRGWCSSLGWLGNELTVGCYSFFSDVKAVFTISTSHKKHIANGAPIIGGPPRLRTWLVRPFHLTTYSNRILEFSDRELNSIYNCAYDRIWEVLHGKYKKDLSKAAGSQDSFTPTP